MDLLSLRNSKRTIQRTNEILKLVGKFGLGYISQRLRGEEDIAIEVPQKETPDIENATTHERMRMLLQELGPTFIKFGQVLSTREDIIGEEMAGELAKLRDNVAPFPHPKKVIEEELGRSVGEVFAAFEAEPMASASLAQVHRAILKNGTKVVVKVQRPGIEETVSDDIRIMRHLADLVERKIPESRIFKPKVMVDEFERSIIKELNFMREVKNATRMRENFIDDPSVHIPLMYPDLCTEKLIVMEEIVGAKLSKVIESHSKKFDKKLIARRGAKAFFKQVLIDGFYHADLHPGNIMIMDDNVVCFLDFGMVGGVDKDMAESMLSLCSFALKHDARGLVSQLVRMNLVDDSVDIEEFRADVSDLLDAYYSTKLEEVKVGSLLRELMMLVSKHGIRMPREAYMLSRAVFLVESVVSALDPKFNAAEEFKPYAEEAVAKLAGPRRLADVIGGSLFEFEYLAKTLPYGIRKLMGMLEKGQLKIEFEHKNLSRFTADLERTTNRLSMSIILAALIVGSSIVMQTGKGPELFGLPALGVIGFVVSALLAFWLLLTMMLHRRE